MTDKETPALARQHFLHEYQAVLSTLSVDVKGYPFGSVVPYCADRSGQPVILISDIAQHTKNIVADPRVSLICLDNSADDQQASGRVTLLADAIKISADDNDSVWRYYSYFPHSRDYHKTHGFDFYRLEIKKIRFIGGFGRIHWLEAEQFVRANPFKLEEEQGIVSHMNEDHADAIRHYCATSEIATSHEKSPEMVGIDAEGIHIKVGKAIHRLTFEQPVKNGGEARKALVDMARAGK